jgi:hypothetical protein
VGLPPRREPKLANRSLAADADRRYYSGCNGCVPGFRVTLPFPNRPEASRQSFGVLSRYLGFALVPPIQHASVRLPCPAKSLQRPARDEMCLGSFRQSCWTICRLSDG